MTSSVFAESIINQDLHVSAAVMFGRGRFQNGVLVDPKPQFKFDSEDENSLEHFRDLIWYGHPFSRPPKCS